MCEYYEAGTLHHLKPGKLFLNLDLYGVVVCSYNHVTLMKLSFTEKFCKVLMDACDLVTNLIEKYSRQNTQNGT